MNAMDGACSRHKRQETFIEVLVGKLDGETPLGILTHRYENNIKMCVREVGWTAMDWIDLAQDRDRWRAHIKAVMNLRVP